MVYEWEPHRNVCHRLYIGERKSLEDIMLHMREVHNFTPSKRAYQTQFKRWGFPSKQNPAHRNMELVARVKELWEQNFTQREMLITLNQEGFEIKERELMRVRAKNRWLLRIPNGMKQAQAQDQAFEDFHSELLQVADSPGEPTVPVTTATPSIPPLPPELPEEIVLKRKERHDQLQVESDERWAAKKRRRRTKDYAGLAADPPGPPRFPSETTLDESKQFLALGATQYRALRDQFQAICEHEGVIKKTLAGTEKWQAVKERLIRENDALQAVLWTDKSNVQSKELALDVICTDVTKRMRTLDRRMSIADAKNALGINPQQSREIRGAFYATLQADHFTSKLETGQEHWQELKAEWISKSPLLQQLLAPGETDPQHAEKKKALEVLCRDVMKRLRDDQTRKKDGGARTSSIQDQRTAGSHAARTAAAANDMVTLQQSGAASNPYQFSTSDLSDLQIDPSLLEAADNTASQIVVPSTAVYIRPHVKSQVHGSDKMWLASLGTRTVQELRELVVNKWPDSILIRIDGVEKDANGQEMSYLIEEDEELDAYLEHVQGRKAVFVVQLNGA